MLLLLLLRLMLLSLGHSAATGAVTAAAGVVSVCCSVPGSQLPAQCPAGGCDYLLAGRIVLCTPQTTQKLHFQTH